jgi:hypothetical protein
MAIYRIYQLDPSDHILASHSFECHSDAAATQAKFGRAIAASCV